MSESEPELGLGVVARVDGRQIEIRFPTSGEARVYAVGTPVLKRLRFRVGETVAAREGTPFVIESVEERDGLLVYGGGGVWVREDLLAEGTSVHLPDERLLAGQVDSREVFDLRQRALEARCRFRRSEVRGFLGGRIDLIPHQMHILHEVASRQVPRVLLADEVGLGKTIEACLILQRLLAVGQAVRVLVLVPESLVHQWFVELLRRFNLWFSIFDEERCAATEETNPTANPFLDEQLVLCSIAFLAGNETRRAQAVAAGWDTVVVDEAHHLEWKPGHPSIEYQMVEALAPGDTGLLLLTATPTQLGQEGHFARLRLLDPDRYNDFGTFAAEAAQFAEVAAVANRIVDQKPLKPRDHAALQRIFNKDPETLEKRLEALSASEPGAREALIRNLLDQHGPGRVIFRNTRAAMSGFPKRRYCPATIESADRALLARMARELEAEEHGGEADWRYSYKGDPRIDWLAGFLRQHSRAKLLLICRNPRKVAAIDAALREKLQVRTGHFHEGMPLVQRDRNAAWFAEPDGAQLLLCSEIGSEGRNFQFAHHLVLFDLPLNPGLVEQRIGRLDRIGQTETIRIHVPVVPGSAGALVAGWYHRGLDAFETPLHGGDEYLARFRARLLELALACRAPARQTGRGAKELEELVRETTAFRRELTERMQKGRDRLLELNSFDPKVAGRAIARIREADADPRLRDLLVRLLDHFGVRIHEHEGGDVFLDPAHAWVEAFPSIPPEGMLATFDRRRAIAREDIRFLSQDHPLVADAVDLLLNSPRGTTAFVHRQSDTQNLVLEAVFVLEAVAESRWHADRFLAPTPVRVVVDLRGDDLTGEAGPERLSADFVDGNIHRFLERPGFNVSLLEALVEHATRLAEIRSRALRGEARAAAASVLGADWQRLVELHRINDHVRPGEIALARERLERVTEAIEQARLRLDSLRLILEGPPGA